MTIPNNSTLKFATLSDATTAKYRIYAQSYTASGNNHINGNNYQNGNNPPHRVEYWYLGTDLLKLNGTADMHGVIYAPYSIVDVQGNFNFYGAIKARELNVTGTGKINYDEALGASPVLTDINFALKKTSQRYR